jgi:LacI family transcriptional regulator
MATVTLKDVARAAGIHYSTASRALDPTKRSLVNAATAARVQEVAESLGYRQHLVARSLRQGRTNTIGIVVPDLDNPSWAPVLHGLTGVLDESGYLVLISETLDDPRRYRRLMEKLAAWRVDAIISAASRLSDAQYLREFSRNGVPLLLMIRTLPSHEFVNINDNSAYGGSVAAEHLAQLGHEVLAELKGPADIQQCNDRSRGFCDEAARRGARVLDFRHHGEATTHEEGRRLMNRLLDSAGDVLTAVFAHNDLMAVGAMDAMTERGLRCPEHISIIGYNDAPLVDHLSPPLSTIRLPAMELGTLAGESVIKLIERAELPPASTSVTPHLVARGSTAPPPRKA